MKPKGEKVLGPGWMNEVLERTLKERGEYITSRFYVVERTPSRSYRVGDGHGGSDWDWSKATEERVSAYFNVKAHAQTFLDAHDPDEGNTLIIKEDKLYRKTVETWY